MNLYVCVNGRYEDSVYYIVPGDDMMEAVNALTIYLESLSADDRPDEIRVTALRLIEQDVITRIN